MNNVLIKSLIVSIVINAILLIVVIKKKPNEEKVYLDRSKEITELRNENKLIKQELRPLQDKIDSLDSVIDFKENTRSELLKEIDILNHRLSQEKEELVNMNIDSLKKIALRD